MQFGHHPSADGLIVTDADGTILTPSPGWLDSVQPDKAERVK